MELLGFDDVVGFEMLRVHKAVLWLMDLRVEYPKAGNQSIRITQITAPVLLFTLFIYSTGYFRTVEFGDIEKVTCTMLYLTTCSSVVVKYITYKLSANKFEAIVRWTKTMVQRRTAKDTIFEIVLKRCLKQFYYVSLFVPLIWVFEPYLLGRKLVWAMFPFLDRETSIYVSNFVEIPVFFMLGFMISYGSTGLVHMVAVYLHELATLNKQWKQLVYTKGEDEIFMAKLRPLVDRHCELVGVFKNLNSIHNPMFVLLVLATVGNTSSFIYGTLKNPSQAYRAAPYVGPIIFANIIEFALNCYMGEKVTHLFLEIQSHVYQANWEEAPHRVRTCIMIVQEFSKKSFFLTGAKVINSSHPTFLETLKQGFSLFTVMRAVS